MKINIAIDEDELRGLVAQEIERRLGDIPFDRKHVEILVKSKQNYRAEWEAAFFRATYEVTA